MLRSRAVSQRKLKVFFHDNCFDGATSAALFADFYCNQLHPGADLLLQGVQHRRGDPFEGMDLSGDDNACVDFRFSPDPKMTWWFDHHVSAFQPAELRDVFDKDQSGQKFFDPKSRSCSKYIARVLDEQFDYRPEDGGGTWGDLVHWADLIDGAQFESPRQAVELAEPALRIMTWLESNKEPALTHRLIRMLGNTSLADLAAQSWIADPLAPILEAHQTHIEVIKKRAVLDQGGGVLRLERGRHRRPQQVHRVLPSS